MRRILLIGLIFIVASIRPLLLYSQDLKEREHILSIELLSMLFDTTQKLPIACTPDEINKMVRQNFGIKSNELIKLLSLLETLKYKLQNGEINKDALLRELVNSNKSSSKLLNYFSGCYILGMSPYFKGIIFFDFGKAILTMQSVGDASHAFCPINNELILNNILRELNSSDYVLVIEGRASLPGGESINDSLSDRRSEVVKNWYISNGISNNRIRVLYLGETGPYITNRVCETYGIEVLYEDCYAYAPRSIDNNGNIVIDGLNQSVTLYLLPPEKINLKLLWP